ncbi:MAG: N-acetyltransferase family protein [Pseudomonadota bacterium]
MTSDRAPGALAAPSAPDHAALPQTVRIRDAGPADTARLAEIYAFHVRHGLSTFEEVPPSAGEMAARLAAVRALALPYLVAERDGRVLGYAYASAYRPRAAYRFTVENSVYLDEGLGGQGIGSLLLAALIERCEQGPWRQMIAVIGNSGNAASLALHRRHGFRNVGTLTSVGFKLGRWVDTVLMARGLGVGDGAPPEGAAGGPAR